MAPSQLPEDSNRGPTVVVISWLFLGLAVVVVSLRLVTRWRKRAHGWDDYLIYVALGVAVYGSILNTLQVKHGFGRHLPFVVAEIGPITMYTTLTEMQSGIGTYLVKCSVCAFVLRLIKGTHRRIRLTIWITIAILTVVTFATVLAIGLQCIPLKKVWHPELPGSCTPKSAQTQLIRIFGVVGTATDFVCVIVPIFIIRGLQVDRRTKVAMIVIVCLGFLTAACGIGKTVTVEIVSKDFTWDYVPVELWALVEQRLGVTVASLPVLRVLMATFLDEVARISSTWSMPYKKPKDANTAYYLGRQPQDSDDVDSRKLVDRGSGLTKHHLEGIR